MPRKGKTMIPPKAFLDIELAVKKTKVTGQSAHKPKIVVFEDEAGICDEKGRQRIGFFKHINHATDAYYPPLLAQLSVGISALYRMTLGERAAEDRLVYSSAGEIIGSASLAIDGFVPMQTLLSDSIEDLDKRALANPSTFQLIERDAAEALVNSWYRKDRDLHPDNIGTGIIQSLSKDGDGRLIEHLKIVRLDFDNSHSNVTDSIRGKRSVQGFMTKYTHNASKLSKQELEHFPWVETRDHWPTHIPQHGALLKIYQAQKAFVDLKDRRDFHEQKHFALLKILLAYQPSVMRERLTALLGDAKLNLSQLPEAHRRELLKDNILQLFYKDTKKPLVEENELTVVEHLMRSEEIYYDELYRLTLKKSDYNHFNQYLISHPEAFQKAYDWFKEQNELNLLKSVDKTKRQEELHHETPFDLDQLENRYIKIWQDAALNTIYDTLNKKLKPILKQLETHIDLKSKKFKWHPPAADALDVMEHAPTLLDNLPTDKDELAQLIREVENLKQALVCLGSFYQYSREKAEKGLEYDLNPTRGSNKKLVTQWSALLADTKETVLSLTKDDKLNVACRKMFKCWEEGLERIDYESHLKARERKLTEAATAYHYEWNETDELPAPKAAYKPPSYPCPPTAQAITEALIEWLGEREQGQIIKTCRDAKTEYDGRLGAYLKSFWGGDRDIGKVLDKAKRQTNYELLNVIFKEGGWDKTSYNTTLLKILLVNMKDQTSVTFKSKHPIIESINLDDLNNHIVFLQKALIKGFADAVRNPPQLAHAASF